jgi:hypothetical protein
MIYPGEYPQPLSRKSQVTCPVLGGYVTARLRVQGNPIVSNSGFNENTTLVEMENMGTSQSITFRLQGTDDRSISGPREWVGSQVTLVPGGRQFQTITPRQTFLEVKGFSGTSVLKLQFESRLKFDSLGFDKTDPFYPPTLFQAKSPLTSAV